MRHAVYLFVSVLLLGCGSGGDGASESDSNNHGYGFGYDVQGASGLRLRYKPVLEDGTLLADVAIYEQHFAEVQACTELTAPPPFVIFSDLPNDIRGRYYANPPLIVIETWLTFKHEATHYLLDHNTGDLDPAHGSGLFAKCS